MKYSRREMGLLLPALAASATASAQAPPTVTRRPALSESNSFRS